MILNRGKPQFSKKSTKVSTIENMCYNEAARQRQDCLHENCREIKAPKEGNLQRKDAES